MLVVQSAHDAGSRPRVVVLHEVGREPLGPESIDVEPLDEESALVPVDVDLNEQQAVKLEACNFHRGLQAATRAAAVALNRR